MEEEVVNAEHYEPRKEDKPARKYILTNIDYQAHPYQVCLLPSSNLFIIIGF